MCVCEREIQNFRVFKDLINMLINIIVVLTRLLFLPSFPPNLVSHKIIDVTGK